MSTKNISDLKAQNNTLFTSTPGSISASDISTQYDDHIDSHFNRIDGTVPRVDASPTGDSSGFVFSIDYPTAYTDEIPIMFKAPATNANGTGFTIQVNALSALGVYTVGQSQISNGTLISGRWYEAIWTTDADGGGTDGFTIINASNTFGAGTFDSITDGDGTGPPNFPYGFTIASEPFISDSDTLKFGYAYQVGNELNITSNDDPTLTAMSATRVAFIDGVNEDLRVYDYDSSAETWSQTGSDLNISGIATPRITALDASSIAYIDGTNDDLRKYAFNGSTWSQVGNDLNITTTNTKIAAMSATRVAAYVATDQDLRVYDFDGTNWSQTGTDLNLSSSGISEICAVSSTRVVLSDAATDTITAYDFDGSAFSQVGSQYSYPVGSVHRITALRSDIIVNYEAAEQGVRLLRFDGSSWSIVSYLTSIGSNSTCAITAINSTSIALVDSTNDDLMIMEWPLIWSKSPPTPPFS